VQTAREKCREHLRVGQPFAFNATNITRQMRRRWIDSRVANGYQLSNPIDPSTVGTTKGLTR
jgi:predicted kinase